MSNSPPPQTHSSLIWTRALNWVYYLGVAVAALDDLRPGVAVAVEDLRPRAKYVRNTLDAVNDIRFCKTIFDNWMTEFDKGTSCSTRPDDRERQLRHYLGLLKKHVGFCSNEANEILRRHVRFASLMAQRIDDASKSQYNLKYDEETTNLAKDISEAADSLSIYVTKMKDNLGSFVSILEEVQVTVKEETLGERILRWLKSVLKVIARILATVCPPISTLLPHSAEPKVRNLAPTVSALGEAARELCIADPETQEEKVSESLDSVILFLKKIVPREVQNAQKNLQRFDEALDIMGLERHMRGGQRVTLYGPDPAAIAKKWRDIAEQYQSELLNDEDPASDPKTDSKTSCS